MDIIKLIPREQLLELKIEESQYEKTVEEIIEYTQNDFFPTIVTNFIKYINNAYSQRDKLKEEQTSYKTDVGSFSLFGYLLAKV